MSREYGFNRNVNAVRRLIAQIEKRANDPNEYHKVMHELMRAGLVKSVNGKYLPAETGDNKQLSALVNRLYTRFNPATCCGLIESGCSIERFC